MPAKKVVKFLDDQKVKYKEIYLGYKTQWVPEGHVGCALTCAPYVVLAKNAVPANHKASDILKMTITEWEGLVLK